MNFINAHIVYYIKSKNEYENILRENNKDIELIKEKCSNLSLENDKLNNV